jgi:hypothetical protein
MSYIGDIARSISRTIAGDNGSITKAFSRSALGDLGGSAVRADINSVSKSLVMNALDNKIITREAFEQASKANDFNYLNYARSIAQNNQVGNKAYQEAVANFQKKSALFDDVHNGTITEAEYFGRNANKGIGIKNTAKGYFFDPTYGGTRTKATIGAAAAGAVGVRYLSGGNMTTNSLGEKDIAGIPFI